MLSLTSLSFLVSLRNPSLDTIVQYSTKQYNSLFAQKHQKPDRTHTGGGLGVPGVGYNLDLLFFIELIVF